MEDKLGAILSNPQLMQQIMNMAQSLGQSNIAAPSMPEPEPVIPSPLPDIDPVMIGKIMSFAGKTNIDEHQKALLRALQPYLSQNRLQKLEKAMRSAKLAGIASTLLHSGAIPFLSGR
jgi:hypothetical protein